MNSINKFKNSFNLHLVLPINNIYEFIYLINLNMHSTKFWLNIILIPLVQPAINSSKPSVGKTHLKAKGMFTNEYLYWVCIATLLVFLFVLMCFHYIVIISRYFSFLTLVFCTSIRSMWLVGDIFRNYDG